MTEPQKQQPKTVFENKSTKDFSQEEFTKILREQTDGLIEDEKILELWNTYKTSNLKLNLVINKANAFKRQIEIISARKTVVLLGSKDHEYYKTVTDEQTQTEKKEKANVFQSFVNYYDCDKKVFGNFSLKGSPKLKSRNIEWGKKCIAGLSLEKSKKNDTIYESIAKVESYLEPNINIEEDIFKKNFILGEHITKDMVDKHPVVILYGEIGKMSLSKEYDIASGEFIPVAPYTKALDNSGMFIPSFTFTLRTPNTQKNASESVKVIKMKLSRQHFGRPFLQLDGWDDAAARHIAQLDREEKDVNTEEMENELNEMFGNGIFRVFVVGSLGSWQVSNSVVYVNVNPTFIFQTNFVPDTLPTKEDSKARSEGKEASKDKIAEGKKLKEAIARNFNMSNINASFEDLDQMGTFNDFKSMFDTDMLHRIVEKVRGDLKKGNTGTNPQSPATTQTAPSLSGDDVKKLVEIETQLQDNLKKGLFTKLNDNEIDLTITKMCEKEFPDKAKLSLLLQTPKLDQIKTGIKKAVTELKTQTTQQPAQSSPKPSPKEPIKGNMDDEYNTTGTCKKCNQYKNNISPISELCFECENEPPENPEDVKGKEEIKLTPSASPQSAKKEPSLMELVNDIEGKNDDQNDPVLAELRSKSSLNPLYLKIARFIYKKDVENTGVDRKDIVKFFEKEAKAPDIVTALKAMVSEYKMLTEPKKNAFSIAF